MDAPTGVLHYRCPACTPRWREGGMGSASKHTQETHGIHLDVEFRFLPSQYHNDRLNERYGWSRHDG